MTTMVGMAVPKAALEVSMATGPTVASTVVRAVGPVVMVELSHHPEVCALRRRQAT